LTGGFFVVYFFYPKLETIVHHVQRLPIFGDKSIKVLI